MLRAPAALAALALLAAGCAPSTTADPAAPTAATPSTTASPDREVRLIGRGMVMNEGSGPKLCFNVAESYPPQCDGVALVGWRWPERGVERAAGSTWGDFAVVGTYDGLRFRVDRTVEPALPPRPKDELRATPCPEPTGGWRAPNPARATYETQDRAIRLAEGRPGYADVWVEELDTPARPATTVLNVSFTTDLDGAERARRGVWGGPLCVSKGERTHAELAAIHRELEDTPRHISSGFGFGHVDITVIHDDGTLQRRLDRKYGEGLVRVTSSLQPYSE